MASRNYRCVMTIDTFALLEEKLGKDRVKTHYMLAPLTTLKIGGSADFFCEVTTKDKLEHAVHTAIMVKIPYFVIGGGSNVVVSDKGIRGLVIRNMARKIIIKKIHGRVKRGKSTIDTVLVEAESGVLVNQLVRFSLEEGLGGLEYHLGLPGSVGGALYMNSKWTKPPKYVGDVLYEALIIKKDGTVASVPKSYFDFGYDQSILQKTHEIVLSASFLLTRADKNQLWETAQKSLAYRNETQPKGLTAGCTFRNISVSDAMRIPTPSYITSAGYLVDQVNLKNFQIGGAQFSDKHANFIINRGGATAEDVVGLIHEAQKRVQEKFKVHIEPEIVVVGDT